MSFKNRIKEIQTMIELRRLLEETNDECLYVLKKHIKKGDSWKTCDIQYLREKLHEEYQEWSFTNLKTLKTKHTEEHELIDLINIAVMLRKRLVS